MASNGRSGGAPRVVIVGGGFGGLYAARALASAPVQITLVDQRNYHLFQPLLYQVATAALSPGNIAQPIRLLLRRHRNVRVLQAQVTGVDLARRQLQLADGTLDYDYLILAPGARHSYFGHDEWAPLAPGLKSLDDALEIRRRILSAFEDAERATDPAVRRALLTFVIVGGGPTGVELAGAIAEIARHTVAGEFRAIDPTKARVILLEGLPRILSAFPEDLAASATQALRALGVEVRTGAIVTKITPDAVYVGDEVIPTRTALWAAGVAASPLGRSLNVPLDRSGRVIVEPDLTIPGHPEVYVVGDLAAYTHQGDKPLPGVAQVAIQEGQAAAENIRRTLAGKRRKRFHYVDRGNLATIGRGVAVADIKGRHLTGQAAWLVWLLVHILYLIGFEKRLLVLVQWAKSYLTHDRGVRLITMEEPPAALPAPAPRPAAPAAAAPSGDGASAAPPPAAPTDLPTWTQLATPLRVRDVMTRDVVTVPPTMPVREVAALLDERRLAGVPVVDEAGRVLGMISELDVMSREGATAADIMTREVTSVAEDTDVDDLSQLFLNQRLRRVPVLAGERLVGIVSRSDVLRGVLRAAQAAGRQP
ncbi:MAG TPA: FAD-dependent oxidoreductase [Chloroflexota bacterium]|nr:FAD-dependent oxidoreductase [Chloroflexota bacterium]